MKMTTFPPEMLYRLVQLAWPLMISQLAMSGMAVTDTLIAGRAGVEELAGVAIGANLLIIALMGIYGLSMILGPQAALYQIKYPEKLSSLLKSGVQVALAGGIVLTFILITTIFLLVPKLVSSQNVVDIAQTYLWYGLPGLLIAALHFPLRFIWEGLGKVNLTLITTLSMFFINIPLDLILVLGIGPFDGLGGAGCGLATSLTLLMGTALSLWLVKRHADLNETLLSPSSTNWPQIRMLLAIGVPAALAVLLEVSLFMLLALLIAPMGVVPLGAHQIALNVTSLLYVLPFSLALAISIEAGRQRAQCTAEQLRKFIKQALLLSGLTGAGLSGFTWLVHDHVPALFTDNTSVQALAASLLLFAVAYQIGDAIQMTSAGILRAFGQTKVVLATTLIAYWGIGLGMGSWLAWPMQWGASGYWFALALGLTLAGAVLAIYLSSSSFWRKTR